MGEPAIRFENLGKTFKGFRKRIKAVDNVSLEIAAGQVYGFLGPNGAGKTTTIRLALDLLNPSTGAVYVFGKHVRREHDVLKRVGAIAEGAAFYPYLSGRKNLEILARTSNRYDPARIDALLKQVDLTERARQRYKQYSLGMKQRLGLAAALLDDPELLILDEPTNGLDPAGIQEMRLFIRDLVDEHGKTVFLSSHLLNEVEQVCDRVAIIDQGAVIREGRVADLLSEKQSLRLRATPLDKASAILQEHWTVTTNGTETQATISVEARYDDAPNLVRLLVSHDIEIFEITREKQSLEAFFLSVTHEGGNHG
jgi:ABC-2 type transport system ATP-binding protein